MAIVGMEDAVKFVQEFDDIVRPKKDGQFLRPYQKEISEITRILNLKKDFKSPFIGEMCRLRDSIDSLNIDLSKDRQIADIESDQVFFRFKRGDLMPFEIDHPAEKMNIISRIFNNQCIKICLFFLDKFLADNLENNAAIGKIMRELEMNGQLLDLVRYENKKKQIELIFSSNEKLIFKKLKFFDKNIENKEKNLLNSITYKMQNYSADAYSKSIETIESEMKNLQIVWTEKDVSKIAKHFWTIDQRPIVRRTLWVVRHADKNPKLLDKNPQLSDKGKEQAKQLGKWFEKVPITKVFASPFRRTLETATLLLGEQSGRRAFINVEPGLGEFLKPCVVQLGYKPLLELAELFPLIDPNYWAVYSKKALELLGAERKSRNPNELKDDSNCHFMVEQTLDQILKENSNAEHILLVTHRDTVGQINAILDGEWATVDQATISKYVQYDEDDGNRFVLEYSGITAPEN